MKHLVKIDIGNLLHNIAKVEVGSSHPFAHPMFFKPFILLQICYHVWLQKQRDGQVHSNGNHTSIQNAVHYLHNAH